MATLRILLIIVFLIAALAVTVVVLLQEGKSAGLGSIGGAASNGGDSYWDKNKKHSLEGKFEKWTKIAAFLFVFAAFVLMFIPTSNASKGGSTNTIVTPSTEATPSADASASPSASADASATTEATTSPEASAPAESSAATTPAK